MTYTYTYQPSITLPNHYKPLWETLKVFFRTQTLLTRSSAVNIFLEIVALITLFGALTVWAFALQTI